MKNIKEITFYKEWLHLPKEQFRILLYIVQNGSLSGNLSDMCKCIGLSPQNKNRNNIRIAIEALAEEKYLNYVKAGRVYDLTVIPQETKIQISHDWVTKITDRHPYSRDVAKENVIKVLLWLVDNGPELFQNNQIVEELGISESVICDAKYILSNDFALIRLEYKRGRTEEGKYYTEGQFVTIAAWIAEN
jgi:hypothetical protein